jgi:hypothetical protein
VICCWWIFFSFFSSSPLKITVWSSLVLIFQLQSLLSWFLIFFGYFVKVFLVFNFILQIKFMILFLPIWSSLFWFLSFYLGLFCISFIPVDPNLLEFFLGLEPCWVLIC